MNPEGATPTSLGFGVERHIEKSRSASEPKEKVEHLTCAVEGGDAQPLDRLHSRLGLLANAPALDWRSGST